MRRMTHICHCTSYRFPHRIGGGQCTAWASAKLCEACGRPAEEMRVDYGIGAYEYWGANGVHRDIQIVSECCEAGLVQNNGLHTHAGWFDDTKAPAFTSQLSSCTAPTATKPSRG